MTVDPNVQLVCSRCGYNPITDPDYDPDEEDEGLQPIGSQKTTSNSVGLDLHKCCQCGFEIAIVECPDCYHKQIEPAKWDQWTNKFEWTTTCSHCGSTVEVEYSGKINQNLIDRIDLVTKHKIITVTPNNTVGGFQRTPQLYPSSPSGPTVQTPPSSIVPGGGLLTQQPSILPVQKGGIKGMNPVYVQNIQVTIPEQAFKDACNNAFGGAQNYTLKSQRTRSGKDVLEIEPKSGGRLFCFIDQVSKDVSITPYKFASRSWLDPTPALFTLLRGLAQSTSGIFEGYEESVGPVVIHGGQTHTAEFYIVKKGVVPDFTDDTNGDIATTEFRIIKTLKEFLQENPEIQVQLNQYVFPDNLNYLGRAIIQLKQEEKLSFDIFKNLLIQAVSLGANDISVKGMYDFIK